MRPVERLSLPTCTSKLRKFSGDEYGSSIDRRVKVDTPASNLGAILALSYQSDQFTSDQIHLCLIIPHSTHAKPPLPSTFGLRPNGRVCGSRWGINTTAACTSFGSIFYPCFRFFDHCRILSTGIRSAYLQSYPPCRSAEESSELGFAGLQSLTNRPCALLSTVGNHHPPQLTTVTYCLWISHPSSHHPIALSFNPRMRAGFSLDPIKPGPRNLSAAPLRH